MASYKETFSAYYDALTEDVDRAVIADRCEELLAQYHPKRELALDLCCGTGTLACLMAERCRHRPLFFAAPAHWRPSWPAVVLRLSGWMRPRRC